MTLPPSLFGRRALLWAVPLAIVAGNLVWMSAFGSGARVRARELTGRLEQTRRAQANVASELGRREQLWIAATENRERIATLYRERFGTERSRFTEQLRELKALAESAGLDPETFAYPEETLSGYGLMRRSFVFSVRGSYVALRNFLHLLETTESFLTVEQIGVSEAPGGLAIRLRLSTFFAAVGSDAEAAAHTGGNAAAEAVP